MPIVKKLPDDIKVGDKIFVRFKGAGCLSVKKVTDKQGMAIKLCEPKYDHIGNWYEFSVDFEYCGEFEGEVV